jgi:predicted nicotinamide N-methyase
MLQPPRESHGICMLQRDASPDDPEPQDAADLSPWLIAMAEFVLAETTPTPLPHVPEITLRLARESVPLWDKIERNRDLRGGPPYWGFAWAAGLALARHVIDHPQLVAGRRVLDLASGSGLIAIAAAQSGAAHVIANDVDPLAVIAISLNADANGVAVEASAADLLPPDSGFDPAAVDVVLVGDVFYDHDLAGRAFAFLARCRAAGCLVLIGDPGRADFPSERLTKISDQSVPVTRNCQNVAAAGPDRADYDVRPAAVWAFAGSVAPADVA